MSLMYLFKVSKQFISSMLPGVLKAITESLQDYVKIIFYCFIFLMLQLFYTVVIYIKGKSAQQFFYIWIYSLYSWTF
jgi:hypothetical protein